MQENLMVSKSKGKVSKGINIRMLKNIILKIGGLKLLESHKRNKKLRNLIMNTLPLGKYSYLNSLDWVASSVSYAEGSGENTRVFSRL